MTPQPNNAIPTPPPQDTVPQHHAHLPQLLFIFGIVGIVASVIFIVVIGNVAIQLNKVYSSLNVNPHFPLRTVTVLGSLLLLLFPIFEIIYSRHLKKEERMLGTISSHSWWFGVGLLLFPLITSGLLVGYMTMSIISPIYSIINQIGDEPSSTPTPIASITTTPSDPTANWNQYNNDTFGLKVKYPTEWKINTYDSPDAAKAYLIFTIYKNELNGARLELFQDFQGDFCDGTTPNDLKITTVDFGNGIKGNQTECSSSIVISYKKDNKNFWLIATFVNNENRDTFNQILSTFKFTDNTSVSQGAAGSIEIAPTCMGPGRPGQICKKPFVGTVLVKDKATQKEITSFTTNTDGTFSIALPEGAYIFEVLTSVGMPNTPKQFDETITRNRITPVTISIDTGIR